MHNAKVSPRDTRRTRRRRPSRDERAFALVLIPFEAYCAKHGCELDVDGTPSLRTFEATDKALEAATLAMDNAEARFEAGANSALEYADARTRLDNARINALRTEYDFVFKTRILDFYMGRPLSL